MHRLHAMSTSTETVQLVLRMRPSWAFVDVVRRFVESFCTSASTPGNRDAQLAVAVHELMQNAIPRSGGEPVELLLEVDAPNDRVTVAVTNPCTDEEWEELRARIEHMNAEPDPLKYYMDTMRRSPADVEGGLGLARVRFEAELDVSAARRDGRVVVLATGRLDTTAAQAAGGMQ